MKKRKPLIFSLIFLLAFSFNSCWIAPVYQDYEIKDKASYFYDYDTMKAVTIAKINKSFKDWHWSTKEFDKKLDKYKNNIAVNTDDLDYMKKKGYFWCVRNDNSGGRIILKDGKTKISSEYYWITCENGESVVFYKN